MGMFQDKDGNPTALGRAAQVVTLAGASIGGLAGLEGCAPRQEARDSLRGSAERASLQAADWEEIARDNPRDRHAKRMAHLYRQQYNQAQQQSDRIEDYRSKDPTTWNDE